MLETSGRRFKAGDVVYLRLRVVGFDPVLTQPEHAIVKPIDAKGEDFPDGATVYYVDEERLISGAIAVKELKDRA
jgi:hypothetical protein